MINDVSTYEDRAPGQRRWSLRSYFWEIRMLANWTIWLPLLLMAGALFLCWLLYSLNMVSYTRMMASPDPMEHLRKPVLDYITITRTTLELLLPLAGLLQVHDILLREWRHGTIAFLITRRSLPWYFAVRLVGILLYLCSLVAVGLLLSWWWTPQATLKTLQASDLGSWFWSTWISVIGPTVFIMALGLCVSHSMANTLAGIILPAACALANWLYAAQLQQSNQTNLIISYLLFGWSEQEQSPQPDAWFNGKLILCAVALLLFACQIMLLKRMTIQRKSAE